MFRVELDREACDGIFACLVRDDRFVEDDAGLATVDPTAEGVVDVERAGERVIATFDGDVEDATLAARACPPDAITVREEP
ncbi:ferredoxin [Haloplanus rallus]|jgi:ferredoxin|uniref:Ferredoxin n=1 Tax=Haloplanus rallus TaxID=1816183 RepID=A0A6B9F222_9EURY|nr:MULTISPECIES: ferredoxin [Haloplanus]QGX94336.1 ferredoxin [Haloplanus rallus]